MKKYLIIAILFFLSAGIFLPQNFTSKEKIVFQIKKGQSLGEISANLEKEGAIWGKPFFMLYAIFLGQSGKLQAGCYFISPAMNIQQIAGKFADGAVAKEKITIPEGFTSSQILQRLNEAKLISDTSTPGVSPSTPGVNPEISFASFEGYLFPDTYEIPYCAEQEKIAGIMTENFKRKTAGLTITPEIVVMASLLEKELKTKEDKEIASGILWKRLRSGMPLQVDAFMWTYENYGLPEKPIANPGLETILAALHPKESAYWYYLSTPEGETIFSKTLEEHNIAKVKYLK